MAQKTVELAKLADIGLKTPTDEDRKSLEPPPAKLPCTNKLWTTEGRMFNEKIIFLNKSTTKFLIIGVHPITFQPTIKICDRTNGSFVSISTLNSFMTFVTIIQHLLAGMEVRPDWEEQAGVKITRFGQDLWKIASPDGFGTIVHRVSLTNFLVSSRCIEMEVKSRDCALDYQSYVNSLRNDVVSKELKGSWLKDFLFETLDCEDIEQPMYNVAFDLICNQEYFKNLPEYAAFIFRT